MISSDGLIINLIKMKNIEQLLNKENWIKYLELADQGGITNHGIAQDIVKEIEEAINYTRCCVTDLNDKHPIEGVNETMQTDDDLEEIQLCGKSNCNRQKLEGNVYCSYHYDINFG